MNKLRFFMVYAVFCRKVKVEEEEEVKPKVVPLSLEELLAKRKAEQEALSKVRAMNKNIEFGSNTNYFGSPN